MSWFKQTSDFVIDSFANPQTNGPFVVATGASIAVGLIVGSFLWSEKPNKVKIIPSPLRKVTTSLSDKEKKNLPVPPDVFPGLRDVSSPYGSIRVYEWGPEDGPKLLFVHGISTPSLALGGLAHALVDGGYRVMMFDLFGRGYSDTPADILQDDRLFATQILLALTSSSLSWTGATSGKFSLIGYSLGGGIAANFASYFPDLLSSLVLLAPSGLFRDSHVSLSSRVLQTKGYIPENIVTALVTSRLKAGPLVSPKKGNATDSKVGVEEAFSGELTASPQQVLSRAYPTLTTAGAVNWQLEHHPGFVASFISSIRYGPIRQETELEAWKRLGRLLTQRKHEKDVTGLRHDKVLIVLGERDNVIHKDDLVEDATSILEGNAQFSFFKIGHEFPSVQYDELTTRLIDFWK